MPLPLMGRCLQDSTTSFLPNGVGEMLRLGFWNFHSLVH